MLRINIIASIFVILVGLFLLIAHQIGDKIKSDRMVAMSMLTCFSSQANKSQLTTSTLSQVCQKSIDQVEHPSETRVIVYNRKWHITLAFEQMKTNNQITWTCQGIPKKLFPHQCR
jgi:DNA-binding transcriptional MocR family regulator